MDKPDPTQSEEIELLAEAMIGAASTPPRQLTPEELDRMLGLQEPNAAAS